MQERYTQVVLHEVDVAQTEDLCSTGIIPGAHGVQVEALADGVENLAEYPAHEGLVIHVHSTETGDLQFLFNQLCRVFLVDQMLGLFFNSEDDDLGQLLVPNLFTVHIQEVLNILDGSFESRDLSPQLREAVIQLLGRALLLEYKVGVERFGKGTKHLAPQPVNQDLLGLDSDYTH